MAILTVQKVLKTGTAPTYAAAEVGGDSFPNSGNELIHVKNGSGVSVTVTVAAQIPDDTFGVTSADHNLSVVIPAGQERMIPPVPTRPFNDVNQRAQLAYSAAASVTVGVFSVGRAA